MTPAPSSARPRALVTGASSGIGAVFAERLARDGHDLILVARRRERLQALAERVGRDFGAGAEVLDADLTDASDVAEVEARVANDELLTLLVNNAGFGGYNPFVSIEPTVIDDLINVHIRAATRLTRAALPGMVRRGSGGIINIASMLALSGTLLPNPLPHRAVYAGAKAYLVAFTQTLAGELNATGVRVQVCLPGMVDTEYHAVQKFDTSQIGPKKMTPEDVVTASLSGLALGEVMCVPALADIALLGRLTEVQRSTFKAGALSGIALAERYRQPHSRQ
jgi:short-subunit dehydrogenase